MKIGFIGTGNIGAPIAGQLLKAGHQLLVHDIRRANAEKLLAAGAEWVDTPTAVAAECDAVPTCLPAPKEMQALCRGPAGLVANRKPRAPYIHHPTNAPSLLRPAHPLLTEQPAPLSAP